MMKNISLWFVLGLMVSAPAAAAMNVFSCEPEWAELVRELGGDKVSVTSATTALQDPHRVEARPSLIAKVRKADLVICSGAELEVGWLPMLLRQAGNGAVMPGRDGYIEVATLVDRLDIPKTLDRSDGDVHASGNPHVHLDPRNILAISHVVMRRLVMLDSANAVFYQQRQRDFAERWQQAILRWQLQGAQLKGVRVVVHHQDWAYLFQWLGVEIAGTLEPKPGLPTTAGHVVELKNTLAKSPARMIVHAAYQSDRAAQRMSQLSGIPVVVLPYTVGGDDKSVDLFTLFDVTLQRLTGDSR